MAGRVGRSQRLQPRHHGLDGDPVRHAEFVLEDELARETVTAEVHDRRPRVEDLLDKIVDLAELGEVGMLSQGRQHLKQTVGLFLVSQGVLVLRSGDRHGDRERTGRGVELRSARSHGVAHEVEPGPLDTKTTGLGHEKLPRERERLVAVPPSDDSEGQPRDAPICLAQAFADGRACLGRQERLGETSPDSASDALELGDLRVTTARLRKDGLSDPRAKLLEVTHERLIGQQARRRVREKRGRRTDAPPLHLPGFQIEDKIANHGATVRLGARSRHDHKYTVCHSVNDLTLTLRVSLYF